MPRNSRHTHGAFMFLLHRSGKTRAPHHCGTRAPRLPRMAPLEMRGRREYQN